MTATPTGSFIACMDPPHVTATVTVVWLFAELGSSSALLTAMPVDIDAGAAFSTFTERVRFPAVEPAARLPLVHVTIPAAPLHVYAPPEYDLKVSPVPSVTLTVTGLGATCGPLFVTEITYVALVPRLNVPGVAVMPRSAEGVTMGVTDDVWLLAGLGSAVA